MQRTATRFRLGRLRAADSPRRARARPMSGYVSGWGTMLVALAALLAARLDPPIARAIPVAGALLVGVLLFTQDRELFESRDDHWTPLAYALTLYLVAFVLFVVIYSDRDPVWLAASETGLCAL